MPTNGDYLKPTISKVISFNETNYGKLNLLKDVYLENARTGIDSKANCEIIEDMQGEGIVSSRNFDDGTTYAARENSGRNRKNSRENNQGTSVSDAKIGMSLFVYMAITD